MANRAKQYQVIAPAGSDTARTAVQPIPENPNRVYLLIQNTGSNPGLVQFKNKVKGNGSDIVFGVGVMLKFDQFSDGSGFNGPTEAVNFGSNLGTTFAVVEGVAA